MSYYPYGTELYHYGIKRRSGRYPYGSGERPFQSTGGPIKKVKGIFKRKEKTVKSKSEENSNVIDKEKIIREGSASDVLKIKGQLTTKELQEAATRIEWTTKLESYASKEVNSGMRKVDNAMNKVKAVTNWAKTGTDAYNTIAKLYNATENGRKNPLPLITGKKDDKK